MDIPNVMDVSMCLGEMAYCFRKMFGKCSLHLVTNYIVMQKSDSFYLALGPHKFFKEKKNLGNADVSGRGH